MEAWVCMNKQKVKKRLFFSLILILILSVGYAVVYNIYYPSIEPSFSVEHEVDIGTSSQKYSILTDKKDDQFLGLGIFYPPNHLISLISQKEHLDLLINSKYKIYNDIYTEIDNHSVHIQVFETKRLFFETVYNANISVLCDNYYIQEPYVLDKDTREIDFTNEAETIDAFKKIKKEIVKFYDENKTKIDIVFQEQTK